MASMMASMMSHPSSPTSDLLSAEGVTVATTKGKLLQFHADSVQDAPVPVYGDQRCPKLTPVDSDLASWRSVALSSMNWRLVMSGWVSKWGTRTCSTIYRMYWLPVRLPCVVTKSCFELCEIHPIFTEPPPQGTVGLMFLSTWVIFLCLETFCCPSVTCRMLLSSIQWIFRYFLKVQEW